MMKFRLSTVLSVAMVMCLCSSMALAQGQGDRPREGRQGGGRGFGGGFGGFGGGRVSGVLGLISNEAVQKELAVDAETTEKLKKMNDQIREELRAGAPTGGREAFQGLSDEERQAKFAEIRAKGEEIRAQVVAKYQPQLKEVLTEDQYTRLQQIYWQSNPTGALSDPELVAALTITQEQQDKIAAVSKEYQDKQRELFSGNRGQGGGREAFTKMQELNKERETKMTDVLTDEQKTKLAELKGKEFDMAQLRGRGFGGGRGGRGGRGGDNN